MVNQCSCDANFDQSQKYNHVLWMIFHEYCHGVASFESQAQKIMSQSIWNSIYFIESPYFSSLSIDYHRLQNQLFSKVILYPVGWYMFWLLWKDELVFLISKVLIDSHQNLKFENRNYYKQECYVHINSADRD